MVITYYNRTSHLKKVVTSCLNPIFGVYPRLPRWSHERDVWSRAQQGDLVEKMWALDAGGAS